MTTNPESPARPHNPGWLSRLVGGQSATSREDIERDAAAELGIQLPEADVAGAADPAPQEEPDQPSVAERHERRPGRVRGWVRGLADTEPAEARRQRLEREAAAELGGHDRPEQRVG